jgi:hypothetical protein
MIWLFGEYLGYKTAGVWIAKIIVELYIYVAFAHLLAKNDWNEVIR